MTVPTGRPGWRVTASAQNVQHIATMAAGSRMSIPAGPAVGQTSTHRPQRVQRSRISLTLRSSEAMNASPRSIIVSLIISRGKI